MTDGAIVSRCDARIRGMGFHIPGSPLPVAEIDLPEETRSQLASTGQEFTFRSDCSSSELGIEAAREALRQCGVGAGDIGLVITAPTLLSAYGFDIPAVAVRAALGLENATCLNLSQGCVGILTALRLADQFLRLEDGAGDVLVVTACKASSLTDGFTHGAFYWGDGAAAAVLTRAPGAGLSVRAYGEISATENLGAMRIRYGDAADYRSFDPAEDFKIVVDFPDARAQLDYITGEQERCALLIDGLTAAAGLDASDIDALFLPSVGRKRVPLLLDSHPELIDRVGSDFRYPHLGGVDVLLFLDAHIRAASPEAGEWFLAMTPAFTAQWGGVLLHNDRAAAP